MEILERVAGELLVYHNSSTFIPDEMTSSPFGDTNGMVLVVLDTSY